MLHSFQKQKKDTVADKRTMEERERERGIYVHTYIYTGARPDSQARDIIGKMASNCGEESGASSDFCGPILGKVQAFC